MRRVLDLIVVLAAGTYFELASVSKEFTAGAILLLQQDGKLSVNDPLAKYFPAFPKRERDYALVLAAAP